MATIKAFSDLQQSKKLAEILPIESADMYYDRGGLPSLIDKYVTHESIKSDKYHHLIPCWSLASLLGVIKNVACYQMLNVFDNRVFVVCDIENKPYHVETEVYYNEVDACVELILKLHELNLL